MSNAEHYALEARIKKQIAEMPEADLRRKMAEFIDGASVGAVTFLGLVLGALKTVPTSES